METISSNLRAQGQRCILPEEQHHVKLAILPGGLENKSVVCVLHSSHHLHLYALGV